MSFLPETIPLSTIFIFLLAAAISLLTSLTNRFLSNPEKSKAIRKEVSEWSTQLRKAQKEGDKKTVDKLMKKQKQILQLQSKMSMQSMKVTLIFFIPMLLIWQFLGAIYSNHEIAYLPGIGSMITLPLINMSLLSLIWWYLLCSMLFGTIFSHVFGIIEVSE